MRLMMAMLLIVVSVVIFTDAGLAKGANTNEASTTEAFWNAAKSRQTYFRNVWLKYRVHEFISKEFLTVSVESRPKAAPPRDATPYSDLHFIITAEYVRKGNLARMVFDGPSVEEGRLRPSRGPIVHVFDGTRTIQDNGAGKFVISLRPEAVNGYASPWDLCGEDLLRRTLEYERSKEIVITERKVSPGATPDVLQLDLLSDTKWRNSVSLLPERGYSVRQFDVFDATGSRVSKYHTIEYKTLDGVPYPIRATYSRYKRYGANAILFLESRLEVISLTTSRGDIPNSLFEVTIPQGADIYDQDQQKIIRNPERVQAVLDEIARESPRHRENRFWGWVGAGGAGAVALALGWWLWRRRARD